MANPASGCQQNSSESTQLESLFANLESEADPSAIQMYLTELCEILSFSEEDTLSQIKGEKWIELLLRLIGYGGNPEIMLLATRGLTYLCDSMPSVSDWIVELNGLKVICGNLLAIEYLDVAEECLKALEKISEELPTECLQAGAMIAVLSYIDFFSTSTQRVAVSTVANICEELSLDCSSFVMTSVPTLCNLLQYEDSKLVDIVASCLIMIVDCFSSSSELMDEICSYGVINKILPLIVRDGPISLSQTTYVELIGLLTQLSTKSLLAVKTLFELNISSIMKCILMASSRHNHAASCSSSQNSRSNQVHEVFKLLNQLIPPVSQNVDDIQLNLAKEKIIANEPTILRQFSADILPCSVQVAMSETSVQVCYCCVTVISSIVYFSTPDMLLDVIKKANISSFLAAMLAKKEVHLMFQTLKMIENLMKKLPGVVLRPLVKEGVLHAINMCTLVGHSQTPPEQSNCCRDNNEATTGGSRCLCNALDPSCTSARNMCKLGHDSLHNLAQHIKDAYFCSESVDSMSESLWKLKRNCRALDNGTTYSTDDIAEKEGYLSNILGQVLEQLNNEDEMSTFEFIESGVVKSLGNYLCNGRYIQEAIKNSSSDDPKYVLTRFQTFSAISLSNSGMTWEDMLLSSLLQKMHNALSSFDSFPVILSDSLMPYVKHADLPFQHSTLHPCLRIRFVSDQGEEQLCDSDEILTVEISTSVDVFEKYIWSKINRGTNVERRSECKCADGLALQEQNSTSLKKPKVLCVEQSQASSIDTSGNLSNTMSENLKPPCSSPGQIPANSTTTSSSNDENKRLVLAFEGKQLDHSVTLYQAILEHKQNAQPGFIVGSRFWNDVYTVNYKKAEKITVCKEPSSADSESTLVWDRTGFSLQKLPFFSTLLLAKLPCNLDKSNPAYDILFVMKIIEGLNRNSLQLLSSNNNTAFAQGQVENLDDLKALVSTIPQTVFVSTKLTYKLKQQMNDPMALTPGGMPLWCSELMNVCPFVFSFEERCKYFYLTAFGSSMYQHPLLVESSELNKSEQSLLEVPCRKRYTVDRSNIIESAAKMMKSGVGNRVILEVQYSEEVGTGVGPTLEFYTLLSREFQKNGLEMWRGDASSSSDDGTEYVFAPFGLFPRPWSKQSSISNGVKFCDVLKRFKLLGQLVAEAVKDKRIFDIPFSKAFYKVVLEQELDIYDIQFIDPDLGRTLLEFKALADRKRYFESVSRGNKCVIPNLSFRGAHIEDLGLEFSLPGYTDYIQSPENYPREVNIQNLEEYVKFVVSATIEDGVSRQVEAFKSGFSEVCSLRNIQVFTEDEFERLLCGEQDTWDFCQLRNDINFDHGYTARSTAISNLLEIIQEFKNRERRAFLQFVTGAPRLPPGGLAALKPKMTVVQKRTDNNPDMDLPSVMTCTNYLKLPPYSSKEIMKEKLLYAINEGQGSFYLS